MEHPFAVTLDPGTSLKTVQGLGVRPARCTCIVCRLAVMHARLEKMFRVGSPTPRAVTMKRHGVS